MNVPSSDLSSKARHLEREAPTGGLAGLLRSLVLVEVCRAMASTEVEGMVGALGEG